MGSGGNLRGRAVRPSTFVSSLANGEPPTLARVNGIDNTDIYSVGFVIGEFVVTRFGRGALVRIGARRARSR
jgi:hypothetical protein